MDTPPGGQGGSLDGDLSRSDLRLIGESFRQDWPLPAAVQVKIVQRLVDYLDRDHPEGATAPDRIVIGAARALAAFGALALKQQSIDLVREKVRGRESQFSLADLVAAAEERARRRTEERGRDE